MSSSYTHGHHDSVLQSHRSRTARNSAAYLLPELRPGQRLLDIGCGPGTLSVDLARRVAPGTVIGVDAFAAVLAEAREHAASAGVDNVEFLVVDAYQLPFADSEFDVVHAHQVLQHLADPVAAIQEMRRVVKPGGIIAVRDSDYGAMTWYPASPGMTRWNELYHQLVAADGNEADAGRRLLSWFIAAGFTADELTPTASTWCYATEEQRAWWAGVWAQRVQVSSFASKAVEQGLATAEELAEIAQAWRQWAEQPEGWFAVLHGEILARPIY